MDVAEGLIRLLAVQESTGNAGKFLGNVIAVAVLMSLIGLWALSQVLQRRRIARATEAIAHPRLAPASRVDPTLPPIEAIRAKLGKPSRRFDASLNNYLQVKPPKWLRKRDDLSAVLAEQDRLRREGLVVWAAMVQANQLLFSPGELDHPISIVWSTDPYFDSATDELLAIAQAAYGLKGTKPPGSEAAALAKTLTDEVVRGQRLRLPASLANGRAVWHSSLLITRRHLPRGVLRGKLLPVWIDSKPTGMALLIPAAYWPEEMRSAWEAE